VEDDETEDFSLWWFHHWRIL